MKLILVAVSSVLLAAVVQADVKWDSLRAKWQVYTLLPRTQQDAINEGWEVDGDGVCGGSNFFNGYAYSHPDRDPMVLLFDNNGYIAGQQMKVIPDSAEYPAESIKMKFNQENDTTYVITVYFTQPDTICTEGRSEDDFNTQGTGSGLWIQTGDSPSDVMEAPYHEDDVTDPWVKGGCLPTMGMHYWYERSVDKACEALEPVFIMYNDGQLTAYGWQIRTYMGAYPTFELPKFTSEGAVEEGNPTCMFDKPAGYVSYMHMYLTDDPASNYC